MRNVLKSECNKGKHGSQIIFHMNFILLILILRLFFPIKTKVNKENVLVLYHKLHNFYQSLNSLLKPFKIEGLPSRIC